VLDTTDDDKHTVGLEEEEEEEEIELGDERKQATSRPAGR
jgi:hypothetical protein